MTATGVAHLAGAEVRTLSGGEFQRVMLARAIARAVWEATPSPGDTLPCFQETLSPLQND